MKGPNESGRGTASERELAREAAVGVFAEEELGGLQAPDLVAGVRSRLEGGASGGGHRRGPVLWAAVLVLGLGAVAGTLWMELAERSVDPEGGEPAGGVQDREPVKPRSLEEIREFLGSAVRLEIRPYTAGEVSLDPNGEGLRHAVELDAQDRAALRACAESEPPAEAAGWAWDHHIDLWTAEGRFLRLAVEPRANLLGIRGFQDLSIPGGAARLLHHHVVEAQRAARFRQARLELSDLQSSFPWEPAGDWDGRLSVWKADAAFVGDLSGYRWAARLRSLDLRPSTPGLSESTLRVPDLPALRELWWPGRVDVAGLEALAQLPGLEEVHPGSPQLLIISRPARQDVQRIAVALLDLADVVEELDLRDTDWEDGWFVDLPIASKTRLGPTIRLDISGTGLHTGLLSAFEQRVVDFSAFHAVDARELSDESLDLLVGSARGGPLRSLDLSGCSRLTSAGIERLLGGAELHVLRLAGLELEVDLIRTVAREQVALELLDLSGRPGEPGHALDAALVVRLAELSRLRWLALRGCDGLGGDGLAGSGLAAFAASPALEQLDVRGCPGVTREQVEALSRARPELELLSDFGD